MELTPLIVEDLKPALNWVVIDTPKKLSLITDFAQRVDVMGFDCETNVAKKFHQRKTRTIQIGNKEEQYVIDLLPFAGSKDGLMEQGSYLAPTWARGELVEALSFVLSNPNKTKVGHNLQFDYETLYWNLGIRSQGFFDTMIAEMMLYAGIMPYYQKSFWGLEDLVGRYCKFLMSKEEQTSFDLESPLTEKQLVYCALDTRLPLAIRNVQLKHIDARGCALANSIENNAIMQFGDMHLNGMYLDAGAWNANVEKTRLRHVENVQTLDSHFLPVVGPHCPPAHDLDALERAWREEDDTALRRELRKAYQEAKKEVTKYEKDRQGYEGKAAINYGSPIQLLNALRQVGFTEQHLADTNDRSLERHGLFPVIKAVQAYRETDKVLKSYSDKFCTDYIDEATGRVHPKIKLLGADTGRTASVDPNIQNIIKKSNVGTEYEVSWRGCFKARPGHVLITSDYNGCIAKGSMIPFQDTWVKIENHPSTKFTGNQPVLELKTKKGFKLTCTPDHRIFTQRGWVEARNLLPEDYLALQSEREISHIENRDDWWLRGFWVGDGSGHQAPGTLSFALGPETDQEELGYWIEKVLEEKPRVWGESYTVTNQRPFADHIKSLFNKKDLRLPFDKLSTGQMAALLSGLFDADGHAGQRKIDVATKFIDFAEDIQQALLSFGILSNVITGTGGFNLFPEGRPYYRVCISDSVSLNNFEKYIGFKLERKRLALRKTLLSRKLDRSNLVPVTSTIVSSLTGEYKKYVFNHIHGRPYTRFKLMKSDFHNQLVEYTRYHWDKLEYCYDFGKTEDVYDVVNQPEERFIASGFVVHNCELRVLAEASQEPAFVDAFRKGWDVHSVGAEIIFGQIWKDAAEPTCAYYFTKDHQKCKCKKHGLLRDQIKAINFGIAYGMEAGKLADGLKITKAEAIKLLKTYKEAFPKLITYLESQGEKAKNSLCSRTLSGRPRFYRKPTFEIAFELCTNELTKKKVTSKPTQREVEWKMRSMWSSIEREGKNAPIQGTNADMAKAAAYLMWQRLHPEFGAYVVAFVHDEFVIECPEDRAEECMAFVEDCMIRGGEMFIKSIPVLVESHISKEWTK